MLGINVGAEDHVRAVSLAVAIREADGAQNWHFTFIGPVAGFFAVETAHRGTILNQMSEVATAAAGFGLPGVPDTNKLPSDSHR